MRPSTITALLAASLVLAGCGLVEDGRIRDAKKELSLSLTDPGSAQWRNVRVVGKFTVCGEVNARNRMGGYVGFTPFFASVHAGGVTFAQIVPPPLEGAGDVERNVRKIIADEYAERCPAAP